MIATVWASVYRLKTVSSLLLSKCSFLASLGRSLQMKELRDAITLQLFVAP